MIGFRGIGSTGEVCVTLFHRVFMTLTHFLWVLRGEMGVEVVSRWAVKLGAERTGRDGSAAKSTATLPEDSVLIPGTHSVVHSLL